MSTSSPNIQFAICIAAQASEDLEVWKVYPVLPDAAATNLGCLRVIDESGEDYLYATDRFVLVELPETVRTQLLTAVNL